jgi:hypothetical protein
MAKLAGQRCLHHAAREAVARCPECGRFYCRECVTDHEGRVLCQGCLKASVATVAPKPRRNLLPLLYPVLFIAGLALVSVLTMIVGDFLMQIPDSFHRGAAFDSFWDTITNPEWE